MMEIKAGMLSSPHTKPAAVFTMNVSDLYGNDSIVSISKEMQVDQIKENAIKMLSSDSESNSNFSLYRLVLVNDVPRTLCDDKTAKQEELSDGDCALLIKSPNTKPVSSLVKDAVTSHEGPSMAAIKCATEGLPSFGGGSDVDTPKRTSPDLQASSPLHVEQTLRKVLLALLDLSYKFMHFDKEVSAKPAPPQIDPDKIKQLTDMGFSAAHSSHALRVNNMDSGQATEWILTHPEPEVTDEPMDTSVPSSSGIHTRSRSFKPNPVHLSALTDMGFSREESTQALKVTGNDPSRACEWLLSDRREETDADSDEPLSPDSDLYKALVSNPTIHVGLHDKKVLEALEDMVENPWRRNNWAYEGAVGNVILQILKFYNKYSTTSPPPNA